MMLYQLTSLRQQFNDRVVLDIDQMDIEAGSIHALLGPNGAGKTTLLDILAFLVPPSSGTLLFQGNPVDPARSDLLALRRRVVLVDQHPIMFSTTVRGNIEFGLKIRGLDSAERGRSVDEVLATVGLERYREARAPELSGGETQRLALARALALRPEVLLCDEPTASVDAENQAVIGELLQRINRELGTTIIFTTHDRLQAAALAQKTLVLENGRLVPTTYENSYACIISGDAGGWQCKLHDVVQLCFPGTPTSLRKDRGRVTLNPSMILLLPETGSVPSDHASLAGRVVLLMEEGGNVRVVVDAGVLMVVLMEGAAYRKVAPTVGSRVRLAIPETACTFIA